MGGLNAFQLSGVNIFTGFQYLCMTLLIAVTPITMTTKPNITKMLLVKK
jgi:hypothetical protein